MRVSFEQIPGVRLHAGHTAHDARGGFTKVFERGPDIDEAPVVDQLCSAYNRERGTVRGLHHQAAPHPESKLVWCLSGAVWDVLVDMRPDQPTYGDWTGMELTGSRPTSLWVPPGVAHGYQTLTDDVTMMYVLQGAYSPEHARTLAWNDPTVGVEWPLSVTRISESDRDAGPWPAS